MKTLRNGALLMLLLLLSAAVEVLAAMGVDELLSLVGIEVPLAVSLVIVLAGLLAATMLVVRHEEKKGERS